MLVELASRLKFRRSSVRRIAQVQGLPDFIVNFEQAPGIGFLAGWRGPNGDQFLKGKPNPKQWEAYIANESFFSWHWPEHMRYMRFINKDYLDFAAEVGFIAKSEPIIMQLYSEPLQKFRLAGQGLYEGPQPTEAVDRERLIKYFDPLPSWNLPLEQARASGEDYPFYAITQRPMMMYHSWDSQNVWLRQIISENYLHMNRGTAERLGLKDFDWIWVESRTGRVRCQMKTMEGVEANTVWTWNAIGKQAAAWGLTPQASEATHGFLLNHLISETLPPNALERRITNSDPITGQAAWFDLRVRITKAKTGETGVWPEFPPLRQLPWDDGRRPQVLGYDSTLMRQPQWTGSREFDGNARVHASRCSRRCDNDARALGLVIDRDRASAPARPRRLLREVEWVIGHFRPFIRLRAVRRGAVGFVVQSHPPL